MESTLEAQFPFKAATASHLPSSRRGFLEKSQVLGKQCLNILIANTISASVINVFRSPLIIHFNKGFKIDMQTRYYEHEVHNNQNKMLYFLFFSNVKLCGVLLKRTDL